MPDYNLGRAHGEISIGYDNRGVRQAQADMAATAGEAAALDAAMSRVNRSFDENRKVTIASAEDLVRARAEVDALSKAYNAAQKEFEKSEARVREAAEAFHDATQREVKDADEIRQARLALVRAGEEAEKQQARAIDSYERYQAKLSVVREEVAKFNAEHAKAANGFKSMSREAQRLGEVLEGLTEKFSAITRVLGQAGLFGLFGGAAAGSLFANAAGGVNLLAGAMSAVVEIAQSFVGALALAPAVINAAALSVGTLAIAFHGIGEALGSLEDPAKFTEAIRDLSPAAQQAMLQIQQFTYAFRGARNEIQNSLFAPIIADIQPLIQTWLPQLMNAGKQIANEFGQSFHQVFQVFQSADAQNGFKTFLGNMITGFQAARGAIAPFLNAWNKLAEVGSGVFPRLGEAIAKIATEFNNWIQRTAASGQLLEFINKALDGFTNMGRIVRDFALGISNVFGMFNTDGKTTLDVIAGIAAKFRDWSESMSGQSAITNFFFLLKAATEAIKPNLDLFAQGLAVVGRTLTVLGIAIQPGINSFFTSFLEALKNLAPYIIQIAPSINSFLTEFGKVLSAVVSSVGPQLPGFFADMSAAFVDLMKVIPPVVDAVANFFSHVTPKEIELIIGLTLALKAVSATIPIVRGAMVALNFVMAANPIGLVITAIGALAAAGVLLVQNWDTVKQVLGGVWDWIRDSVSHVWDEAYQWGSKIINQMADGISNAARSGLTAVIDWVASLFPDSWKTNSPSKRGPLSEMSPEEMGARLVTQYAGGLASGRPAVEAAVDGVAGSASAIGGSGGGGGTTGTGFSSAGISGSSGGDFSKGHSGFDQWVSFITQDLTAWSNIFQEAFGLVNSIADSVIQTTKVVASLWNQGNNPLTQPGGIAGPPLPISQQEVPGVQNIPIPGKAPLPNLVPKNAGGAPQIDVAGVPSKPLPNSGPGRANEPGNNAPASVTPPPVGGPAGQQGDSPLASSLRRRGVSEEQIRLIEGFSKTEGLNPAGNPTLGFMDSQLGGDTSLEGHVDALLQQFKDRENAVVNGQRVGAFPAGADDRTQAEWIASVVGQNSSPTGPDGLPQPARSDYVNRVIGGLPARGAPGGVPSGAASIRGALTPSGQVDASKLPEGLASPKGLHPNAELLNRAVTAVFGDRIKAANAGGIGGSRANDSGSGEHQGGALDIMVGDTPEGKQLGDEINAWIIQNGAAFGVQWNIWQQNLNRADGSGYRMDTRAGGDRTQNHYDHVHAFTGDPNVENTPDNQGTGKFTLPAGFQLPPEAGGAGPGAGGAGGPGLFGPAGIPGPTPPKTGGNGALGVAGAAALGAGGVALLSRAIQKRMARAAADRGEILDVNEAKLALEGETPTETKMIEDAARTSPEVASIVREVPNLQGMDAAARNSMMERLIYQGIMTPEEAARINPDLKINAYHATSPEGAKGILENGFQQAPGRNAFFANNPQQALTNRKFYGESVVGGRVPVSAWEGPGVPTDRLGGIQFSEYSPEQLQRSADSFRAAFQRPTLGQVERAFGGAANVPPELADRFANFTPLDRSQIVQRPGFAEGNPFGSPNASRPAGAYLAQDAPVRQQLVPRVQSTITPPRLATAQAEINYPGRPSGKPLDVNIAGDGGKPVGGGGLFGKGIDAIAGLGKGTPTGVTGAVESPPIGSIFAPGGNAPESKLGAVTRGAGAGFGASLSLANAGLIAYGIVGGAAEEAQRRFRDDPANKNKSIVQDGSVLGIPASKGYVEIDSSPVSRDMTPAEIEASKKTPEEIAAGKAKGDASRRAHQFGQRAAGEEDPAKNTGLFGAGASGKGGITVTQDGDLSKPIPQDQLDKAGIPKGLPPIYPSAQPGTVQNVPVPPDYATTHPESIVNNGTTSLPTGTGQIAGFPQTTDQRSPIDKISSGFSSAASIAGDGFKIFGDVIADIGAAADATHKLVRGLANTEDVVGLIRDIQPFLQTGADIAKMVGDVGGIVAGAGSADPTGGAGAAGAAVQAIASIVSSAFEAVNQGITLGIDIYHEVGKYAGYIMGGFLGGANTGPLGGNVRMLLNTRTNQLQTYSEDNPLNKNTFNVPTWQQSYQQQPNTQQQIPSQVNIYTGPGQSPRDMMNESMWLVGTGGASVASVAGSD